MQEGLRVIIDEILLVLGPLVDAAQDSQELMALLADLGWTPNSVPQPLAELAAVGKDLVNTIGADPERISLNEALAAVKRLVDAINAISTKPDAAFPSGIDISSFKQTIGQDLLDYVLVEYLLRNCYPIGGLLKLVGIIRLIETPATGLRQSYLKREVVWSLIGHLLTDPTKGFRDVFDWNSAAPRLTQAVGDFSSLLESFGLQLSYFEPTGDLLSFINADAPVPLNEPLGIDLTFDNALGAPEGFAAGIQLLIRPPTTSRGSAISFLPYVSLNGAQEIPLSDVMSLSIRGKTDFTKGVAITLAPEHAPEVQAGFLGGMPVISAEFQIGPKITPLPGQPERCLIGTLDSSHFAIRTAGFFVGAQLVSSDKFDVFAAIELEKGTVVVLAGDGDGFLQKILPKDGIHLDFDLTVGWSNKRGLYFGGGAGFETTLPVNVDLAGVIKIDSVYLALEAKEDSKKKESAIRAAAATTVKVQLGPVSAIVERFGLQATLSFPEKGGNLGVANLDLGFKPPNGIGLVIKAQVVTGGGYLYFDFEKEQYAGVLQLEIAQKFSLTAVGLLTTKMPDGKPGFSLLVIISVRFDPGIQLGYGFSLNGLGGLLGVNRIANTKALQEGLRRGALGSILFPQNVVENAPQIISNLSAIFPPARDRFLFGPMAIIGWGGSPPLLSMEIGIILEFSESFRLMILGRLRVTLPGKSDESGQAGDAGSGGDDKKQDTPKIKLQLDTLGIFDFGSGEISLDAYLYDSTIGPFTITGGMALRISFGAKPMFLLSVGGYHPAFQAPAGFPSIERVAFGLHKKEDSFEVRLQLSAYFALTSNTVQFGSHLDLYVHIAGFVEIIGLLRFDVLIQFQPFRLIASFEAMVAVKAGGQTLMAVGLQVNLEGPSPWHVWGKAHFTLLFFSGTAEFDALIGKKETETPRLPPSTNVANELFTELQKLSNWSSQLPVGENPLVTFKDSIPPKDPSGKPLPKKVLVHPLAELHINQRLIPLNADPITKYGTTTPSGATTFTLMATEKGKTENTSKLSISSLSDWFARAQFYVMSDAEKLAAPSFEQKHSGVRVTAAGGYICGEPVTRKIDVAKLAEAAKLSKDEDQDEDAKPTSKLEPGKFLDRVAHLGAAGQSPMRAARVAKYGDPSWWDQGITLSQPGYRVVGEEDDGTAPKARTTRRTGAPSPSSLFEEAMDEMAAIAEPVMSYSAAQARATRARQRSPKRRTWVVPDVGVTRGGR